MKTDVFRWRLSSRLKTELEEAARAEGKTFPDLLEEIAKAWLQRNRSQRVDDVEEEERQRHLHEEVMKLAGTIKGGPDLAENAQAEVRLRIARRHGRSQ